MASQERFHTVMSLKPLESAWRSLSLLIWEWVCLSFMVFSGTTVEGVPETPGPWLPMALELRKEENPPRNDRQGCSRSSKEEKRSELEG